MSLLLANRRFWWDNRHNRLLDSRPDLHHLHIRYHRSWTATKWRTMSLFRPFKLFKSSTSFRQTRLPRSHVRWRSYLAPPFLLEDYTPRYQYLSSLEASKKRSTAYAHLSNCNLCPRLCGVNRFEKTGTCLIGADVTVNTIAPHLGEEPCIQGHNGSGSVLFSGCNLRCVFCQNHDIAHQKNGFSLQPEALAEWYIKLQDVGDVHNINLVTPEHVVPQVVLSILHARDLGLKVPIVYNTSSFDSLASLELLDGLIDILLECMTLHTSLYG